MTCAKEETEKRRFGTSKQKPLTIDQKEPSMLREGGAFETVFERWAEPSGYSDRRADGKDAPSTRAAEVGDPGMGGAEGDASPRCPERGAPEEMRRRKPKTTCGFESCRILDANKSNNSKGRN